MKKIYTLLLLFISFSTFSQFTLTTVRSLEMQSQVVQVPPQFSGAFPASLKLNLPQGFKVSLYYAGGLGKPRFITFDPKGVMHVSDMGNGKIYAMPDKDRDGLPDTVIVVAQGFSSNHDVKFYKGHMYVAESEKVWKCTDADDDGIYESKVTFIDNIGGGVAGGHATRTIIFDSVNAKAYLSIGSQCNVCRESSRALIEQYNDDGTNRRIYATGIRNAVGLAIHPETNRLWANNNGSDNQGNETPPEWIDLVRDGGFYGYPFAYAHKQWFDFSSVPDYQALRPITAVDSALVDKMIMPAALIRAHQAPMAMEFLNTSWPQSYRKGFMVALRGSWNTTSPKDFRGYKVVYADLATASDTTVDYVADFAEGFLTDSINRVYWGRPVGLAADHFGNLFISSDETNKVILRIYNDALTGLKQTLPENLNNLRVYPNPFQADLTITFGLRERSFVKGVLYDLVGKEVKTVFNEALPAGDHKKEIRTEGLKGIYFLRIEAGERTYVQKITAN